MALTHPQLKSLAHTARMLQFAQDRPNHDGKEDHRKSIRRHSVIWQDMTDEQKAEAKAAVAEFDGMTPELIDAATAALEE